MFLCKFSIKLPLERNFLAVEGDLGKIIDIVMRKLYCLKVFPGDVGYD
jgi:hypothetical protein